jgi:hypothetical protein
LTDGGDVFEPQVTWTRKKVDRFNWNVAVSGCAGTRGVPVVELFSSVFYYYGESVDKVVIVAWC